MSLLDAYAAAMQVPARVFARAESFRASPERKQSARYPANKGALSLHHRAALSIYRWCERKLRSAQPCSGATIMPAQPSQEVSLTFEYRLAQEATNLRQQAKGMPVGVRRTELLRKAQQIDVAGEINKWLTSPGLQPPS